MIMIYERLWTELLTYLNDTVKETYSAGDSGEVAMEAEAVKSVIRTMQEREKKFGRIENGHVISVGKKNSEIDGDGKFESLWSETLKDIGDMSIAYSMADMQSSMWGPVRAKVFVDVFQHMGNLMTNAVSTIQENDSPPPIESYARRRCVGAASILIQAGCLVTEKQ
jgi:hypothetical protein